MRSRCCQCEVVAKLCLIILFCRCRWFRCWLCRGQFARNEQVANVEQHEPTNDGVELGTGGKECKSSSWCRHVPSLLGRQAAGGICLVDWCVATEVALCRAEDLASVSRLLLRAWLASGSASGPKATQISHASNGRSQPPTVLVTGCRWQSAKVLCVRLVVRMRPAILVQQDEQTSKDAMLEGR